MATMDLQTGESLESTGAVGAGPANSERNSRVRPNRRRLVVAALLSLLALAGAGMLAPSADAASTTGGDFSSLLSYNPETATVDDCVATLGFVYDGAGTPTNYHRIGGVSVSCRSVHSTIDATVAIYYWNGSSWVQYGAGKHGVLHNVASSGSGISGILPTPPQCVGSLRSQAWMVGATVRTERAGGTFYTSNHYQLKATGC